MHVLHKLSHASQDEEPDRVRQEPTCLHDGEFARSGFWTGRLCSDSRGAELLRLFRRNGDMRFHWDSSVLGAEVRRIAFGEQGKPSCRGWSPTFNLDVLPW